MCVSARTRTQVTSKLTGDLFNHSLFDMHIRVKCVPFRAHERAQARSLCKHALTHARRCVPFLEATADVTARLITARDVMAAPVVSLMEVVRVREVPPSLPHARTRAHTAIQARKHAHTRAVGAVSAAHRSWRGARAWNAPCLPGLGAAGCAALHGWVRRRGPNRPG